MLSDNTTASCVRRQLHENGLDEQQRKRSDVNMLWGEMWVHTKRTEQKVGGSNYGLFSGHFWNGLGSSRSFQPLKHFMRLARLLSCFIDLPKLFETLVRSGKSRDIFISHLIRLKDNLSSFLFSQKITVLRLRVRFAQLSCRFLVESLLFRDNRLCSVRHRLICASFFKREQMDLGHKCSQMISNDAANHKVPLSLLVLKCQRNNVWI